MNLAPWLSALADVLPVPWEHPLMYQRVWWLARPRCSPIAGRRHPEAQKPWSGRDHRG